MAKFTPELDLDLHAKLAHEIAQHTQCEILFDAASRGRYATDASIYQIMPIGVVVPRSLADAQTAIAIATQLGVPVLPRGAGTSQCGQTVGAALVLDNSKYLNQLLELEPENNTATVQSGMVLDTLNAALKKHNLWFPVDVSTAAQATIGGMAGNNSCGSRSIAYGNMVHNVLAIDALLADGTRGRFEAVAQMTQQGRLAEICRASAEIATCGLDEIKQHFPKVLRRVGGYNLDIYCPQSERPYTADNHVNLAHLLVGSEGTLAYFEALKLQLAPLPAHKVLGVVNFKKFYDAMASAQHIVKLQPTAVELVDATMINLARNNPAFKPVIERALIGQPEAILLVEFSGDHHAELLTKLNQLDSLISDLGEPHSVVKMPDAAAQKALWEVRKAGLNIMMSLRGDGKPVSFIEDCAVPLEHLADYTARLTEVFERHGTRGTWYAHASVGTLHVRPILDMRQSGAQGGAAKMRAIAQEASALVRQFKGAYSGEHGDGIARSEWVEWQFGETLNQAFIDIKKVFDPRNLMNPGKIVRPPKMDDASLFRFKPDYKIIPLKPALDWQAWNVQNDGTGAVITALGAGGDPAQGLAKAVEMCNNNGHCRKFDAGTMCPSYRITHDEQHLTRGRANTLRLALSGQISSGQIMADAANPLASQAVHDALDLCVSCKGCKRECPTGVDMAKMKIEATAAYKAQHGLSLRDKLVGYLPHYASLASKFAGLINFAQATFGAALNPMLGFAKQRSLPTWSSHAFKNSEVAQQAAKPQVLLFADTFNRWFEPENLRAAVSVLELAGYGVQVLQGAQNEKPLCCGRTFLSAGLVQQAKDEAARAVAALQPALENGWPIIGLEPSCLFTLRDEFTSYGLGEVAEKIKAQAFLFEEFLEQELQAGRAQGLMERFLSARGKNGTSDNNLKQPNYLIHGHCHQKAFDALTPTQALLKRLPNAKVEMIESSCCGMAGSFGYEAEHYTASMQMAELALLPAVRKASTATVLVADGTSCRHQIADGAGKQAQHVARVLAQSLGLI